MPTAWIANVKTANNKPNKPNRKRGKFAIMPYKKKSKRTLERRERYAEQTPILQTYRRQYHKQRKPDPSQPSQLWIEENQNKIERLLEYYENENGKLHAELKDLLRQRDNEQRRVEYMNLTPEKRASREKRQLAYQQQLASKTI